MCTVVNCVKDIYAHGLCHMHYQRNRKYGDPLGGLKNHAPPEERFWRFVEKTDQCWKWTGKKNNGYGVLSKGAKFDGYFLAHRFSWEMHNAEKIPEGMVVMHSCDNPGCTNPAHLKIGTPKDNTKDMIEKGRKKTIASFGLKNGQSVLSDEKVRFIRSSELSSASLAKDLKVSESCINGVRSGRTWSHVI